MDHINIIQSYLQYDVNSRDFGVTFAMWQPNFESWVNKGTWKFQSDKPLHPLPFHYVGWARTCLIKTFLTANSNIYLPRFTQGLGGPDFECAKSGESAKIDEMISFPDFCRSRTKREELVCGSRVVHTSSTTAICAVQSAVQKWKKAPAVFESIESIHYIHWNLPKWFGSQWSCFVRSVPRSQLKKTTLKSAQN